ncbi:MAG: hypothetical protein ICV84_01490 [Flavisolibacter sp.]|nr:hypothetical protein [Flavisolibacter sp.]MBD0293864.1 hypothetical protein [Flavisolibacter sp.]
MVINNSLLFGDQEYFAIEIKPQRAAKKFYLKFWFEGNVIGDFGKAGSLDYIINEYFRFLQNKDSLYDEKFRTMTDMEIYKDIVLVLFTNLPEGMEDKLYDRMNRYAYTFGDYQFTNFSFLLLSLREERKVKVLVYEMDGENEPKLHSYKIDSNQFLSVYKQFLRYAYEHDLKKKKPFFPERFSYKDIE